MIQSELESIATDATPSGSGRIIHDLRAPLIVAIGYLDELRIFKQRLLDQLLSAENCNGLETSVEQMAREVEEEMGLSISMIEDSLDQLDTRVLDLRKRL